MPRRQPLRLAVVLAVAVAATGASLRRRAEAPIPIEADAAYAVDVVDGGAVVDLPFDDDSRYRLIVGCLGDDAGDDPYQVQLSSEPTPRVERQPLSVVPSIAGVGVGGGDSSILRSMARSAGGVEAPTPATRSALGWGHGDSTPAISRATGGGASPPPVARPARVFHIHVTDGDLNDPRQYARVNAALVREGRRVNVYLDRQTEERRLARGVVDEIVRLCDDDVLPALETHLGRCRDVDGDGRVAILISPWLGVLQGGRTSIGGFVRSTDFRSDQPSPMGDRTDVLYVNSSVVPGPHLKTLLAHELTHAVAISARLPDASRRGGLPDEEDWVNEGLAHLSENRFGDGWSNLDHRAREFLNQPSAHPLVVADYYRTGRWRNHGCRGATWLFHRWCADTFGDDVAARLIHGPSRGTVNLRHATGVSFDDLFRAWTFAMMRSTIEGPPGTFRSEGSAAGDQPVDAPVGRALLPADSLRKTTGRSARPTAREAGYRTVDLCGRLGRYLLAGPRVDSWDVDGPPRRLELAGTSAAYLELTARSAGVWRVRIHAPDAARLQVTVVKMPKHGTRLDVSAEWRLMEASGDQRYRASSETASTVAASLEISVGGGSSRGALGIESVAFEEGASGTAEQAAWTPIELEPFAVAADEPRSSRARFALPAGLLPESFRVKVVARDAEGRRCVKWIDSPPRPMATPVEPLRVAERGSRL